MRTMETMGRMGIMGLICLIGLIGNVQAQATLSADTIVLGDTTVLTLKGVDHADLGIDSNEFLEVLKEENGSEKGEWKIYLTSYDPGIHYVKLSDNDSLQLVVLGVDVDPRSDEPKEAVDADIEDIVDIEPEVAPPAPQNRIPWLLIALGVAVAALLTWWLIQRRKKTVEKAPTARDTRTPEERALQRIEELRKRQLWQSGRVKEYYTELTDTLRVFIEEATGIHAIEMTSDDCLNALMRECMSADATNTLAIKQSDIQALKDIFTTADLVKFAKSEPLPHEHQRVFDQSVAFVKEAWATLNPKPALTEEKAAEIEKEAENG